MEYWFTADLHLGHANIIKLCGRPYSSLGEMDYDLIRRWNERVKPEDTVFCIGDFCFKNTNRFLDYCNQLNGNTIFLRGNHDGGNGVKTPIETVTIRLGGKDFLLVHRPQDSTYGFDLILCGHTHQKWKFNTYRDVCSNLDWDLCNVGVDVWKFYPITVNEILKEYGRWKNEHTNP